MLHSSSSARASCAFGVLLTIGFSACNRGGGTGFAPQNRLVFTGQPSNAVAGEANSPAIVVQVQDASGRVVPAGTARAETPLMITLAIEDGPPGAVITGTSTVMTDQGIATFDDVRIERAGTGFTLRAEGDALTAGVSGAFDITPAAPAGLAFSGSQVVGTSAFQDFSVEVEIQDEFGNATGSGTDTVGLSIEANPGALVLHNSGISDGRRIIELVDPLGPAILGVLSVDGTSDEILGMVYDAEFGVVWGCDRDDSFYMIDPATGDVDMIGTEFGLSANYRGLALNNAGSIRAARRSTNEIWTIDKTTGVDELFTRIDPDGGGAIEGFNGLARDPLTGTFYAIVRIDLPGVGGGLERWLATVRMGTGTATVVGQTEDGIAALGFMPDGTLLGVAGDGGDPPETLYRIDKQTAAATEILPLGGGNDGECITTVPARLRGTREVDAVAGVASFGGLRIDAAGMGYTLVARAPGLTDGTSEPFDIGIPAANGIVDFVVASQAVPEGTSAAVELSMDGPQPNDVFVDILFDEDNSTAVPVDDVDLLVQTTVRIPAGETTASLTVAVIDDLTTESDETAVLTIRSVGYGLVGTTTATHTITILDD